MPTAPITYRQLMKAKPKAKPLYELRRAKAGRRGFPPRMAKRILRRDPICKEPGCERPATDADHIVPKSRGGEDTMSNGQGLCHSHHSQKTATEDGGFGR